MDIERPPNLRSPGTEPGPAATPLGGGLGGGAPPINALAELVADLIAATGLVPRGQAGHGPERRRHGLLRACPCGAERRFQRRARPHPRRPLPDAARRPGVDGRRPRGEQRDPTSRPRAPGRDSRTPSRTGRSGLPLATPATFRESTSCGSRRATRSTSAWRLATTSSSRSAAWPAPPRRSAPGRRRRGRAGAGGGRGGGRRPRGRRRHLRCAARSPRQLRDLPGRRGRGLRRPLRAAGGFTARPLPRGRRAQRGPADPEADDAGCRHATESAGEAGHRRAA